MKSVAPPKQHMCVFTSNVVLVRRVKAHTSRTLLLLYPGGTLKQGSFKSPSLLFYFKKWLNEISSHSFLILSFFPFFFVFLHKPHVPCRWWKMKFPNHNNTKQSSMAPMEYRHQTHAAYPKATPTQMRQRSTTYPRTPLRSLAPEVMSEKSEAKAVSQKPDAGAPPEPQKKIEFSFMKETTASIQKKQSTSPFAPSSFGVSLTRTPSFSLSTDHSSTKKRLEYSRNVSNSHRIRRLNSHGIVSATKLPCDITNLSPQKNTTATPTKTPRHVSCSFTQTQSQSQMQNASPSKPRRNFSHQPTMSHNSGDVFERLYNSPQRSHVRRVASSQLPAPKRCPSRCKIDSIEQLYRLLFERDPNLFSIKDYGWEISHRPSLNIDDIPLSNLNVFERGELMRKRSVYYVPTTSTFPTAATAQREIKLTDYEDNFGFDDVSGNYKVNLNDHINYRYQVLRNVGKGSFGKVILVQDHKVAGDDFLLALKIINNNPAASLQSVNEIKMLKCIKDHGGHRNVVEFFNQFNFRSHICITTELLSLNLYSLLEVTKFQGFSAPVVAQFGRQILQGISFLHGHSIIHCDIKPENIMVKLPADHESTELNVKLIDFGSSCFDNEQCFSYIQSRFYRAPEIILGAEYNNKIDIWSVGCVLAELFTGVPLLPGKNEIDQVGLILGIFGAPKSCTIQRFRSQLAKSFQPTTMDIESRSVLPHANQIKKTLLYKIFDQNGKINLQILNQYKAATPDLTSLKKQFRLNSKTLDICMGIAGDGTDNPLDKQSSMTRFLQKIFVWDPMARESADALLADSFLS